MELSRIIGQLEQQRGETDKILGNLRAFSTNLATQIGATAPGNIATHAAPQAARQMTGKRTISATARKKMALAQKKRWAARKALLGTPAAPQMTDGQQAPAQLAARTRRRKARTATAGKQQRTMTAAG